MPTGFERFLIPGGYFLEFISITGFFYFKAFRGMYPGPWAIKEIDPDGIHRRQLFKKEVNRKFLPSPATPILSIKMDSSVQAIYQRPNSCSSGIQLIWRRTY